ncbi:MAG: LptE family protein [Candidatus Glassbacteria bacterium]
MKIGNDRSVAGCAYLMLILFLSSCGVYSTSTQIAPHLKTVYVPTFKNKTSEFYIPQLITDGIIERLLNESNLRVSSTEDADSILRGTILDYRVEALAYTGEGEVKSRRVRLLMEAEFVDQIKNKVIWKADNMERWGTYDSDTETERDGAERAIEKLAQDIVTQSLQGW